MPLISEHFSIEELCRSSTALRHGIDNTPPAGILDHLAVLANGLEDVRALLGAPVHVDSGYRSPKLNAAVCGAKKSAHLDGYAADFICSVFGTPLQIVKAIEASGIRFDQCIQEGAWVHISFAPAMRGQLLTAHFGPTGTTYTQGA